MIAMSVDTRRRPGEQHVEIVGDLATALANIATIGQLERHHGAAGVLVVLGVPDLGQGLLRLGWADFGSADSTLPILWSCSAIGVISGLGRIGGSCDPRLEPTLLACPES
jgi:hypothetical protein